VLNLMVQVHQIERLGGFFQVADEFGPRDSRLAVRDTLVVPVPQAAVGQLHDDDELTVDDLESLERQDERVTDRLAPVQRLVLLLRGLPFVPDALHVAKDELDGLVHPSGRFGFPDLAEPAAAQPLEQAVAWNWFNVLLNWLFHRRAQGQNISSLSRAS